jgi:hypothetical protein
MRHDWIHRRGTRGLYSGLGHSSFMKRWYTKVNLKGTGYESWMGMYAEARWLLETPDAAPVAEWWMHES